MTSFNNGPALVAHQAPPTPPGIPEWKFQHLRREAKRWKTKALEAEDLQKALELANGRIAELMEQRDKWRSRFWEMRTHALEAQRRQNSLQHAQVQANAPRRLARGKKVWDAITGKFIGIVVSEIDAHGKARVVKSSRDPIAENAWADALDVIEPLPKEWHLEPVLVALFVTFLVSLGALGLVW